MKESVGKAASREIFFAECLLDWLPPERIRAGNFLVLLGDEPRELAYLDALGVPRSQVFSVERLERTYRLQLGQQLGGVHLYCGELIGYLDSLFQGDQEFLVFNLDVEGSYLSQLDPAMTPVLLLCWRNPDTVVATYSSIGRDTEMLWEGVKSLALCLWLARERTLETLASLTKRYEQVGFEEALHLALRDFFWMRSMLEHTLTASVMMGVTSQATARDWLVKADLLWHSVTRWRRHPLRLRSLIEIVDLAVQEVPGKRRESILYPSASLGSSIRSLRHLLYNGEPPWSQLCYFTRLRFAQEAMSCRKWLDVTLEKFLKSPLIYIDWLGVKSELGDRVPADEDFLEKVVWAGSGLYESFRPRELRLLPTARLIKVCKAALAAREESSMAGKKASSGLVNGKGELTEDGKMLIQAAARKWRKNTAVEILEKLPSEVRRLVPEGVVRAHVAVGRRK